MSYTKNPVNPKAPSNNASWTAKDDSLLKEMASKKASTAEIANALGRTKASVWCRKSNLEIGGRLASSKGKGVSAPTTVSTKLRRAESNGSKVTKAPKFVKVKKVNTTEARVISQTNVSIDFASLSRLAKESGAKIVITFE